MIWDFVAALGTPFPSADYQSWMGSTQNQMANAYNSYNAQSQFNHFSQHCGIQAQLLGHPPSRVTAEPRKVECEGCGAPLKAYIHHCEYCRRAK